MVWKLVMYDARRHWDGRLTCLRKLNSASQGQFLRRCEIPNALPWRAPTNSTPQSSAADPIETLDQKYRSWTVQNLIRRCENNRNSYPVSTHQRCRKSSGRMYIYNCGHVEALLLIRTSNTTPICHLPRPNAMKPPVPFSAKGPASLSDSRTVPAPYEFAVNFRAH